MVDEIVNLLKEMHSKNMVPNIVTYNSVIRMHYLQKINDCGIQADAYTYTILIDRMCKCGRFKNALEIFRILLINGCHLHGHTYNVMISGLSKVNCL